MNGTKVFNHQMADAAKYLEECNEQEKEQIRKKALAPDPALVRPAKMRGNTSPLQTALDEETKNLFVALSDQYSISIAHALRVLAIAATKNPTLIYECMDADDKRRVECRAGHGTRLASYLSEVIPEDKLATIGELDESVRMYQAVGAQILEKYSAFCSDALGKSTAILKERISRIMHDQTFLKEPETYTELNGTYFMLSEEQKAERSGLNIAQHLRNCIKTQNKGTDLATVRKNICPQGCDVMFDVSRMVYVATGKTSFEVDALQAMLMSSFLETVSPAARQYVQSGLIHMKMICPLPVEAAIYDIITSFCK